MGTGGAFSMVAPPGYTSPEPIEVISLSKSSLTLNKRYVTEFAVEKKYELKKEQIE